MFGRLNSGFSTARSKGACVQVIRVLFVGLEIPNWFTVGNVAFRNGEDNGLQPPACDFSKSLAFHLLQSGFPSYSQQVQQLLFSSVFICD